MQSEAQKRANRKWDAANMKLVGVKLRRDMADEFEAICTQRGTTRNAVLLAYVKKYIADAKAADNQDSDAND